MTKRSHLPTQLLLAASLAISIYLPAAHAQGAPPPAAEARALPTGSATDAPRPEKPTEGYDKPYEFTQDWFSSAIPIWQQVLAPYAGKPNLRYLEVGIFQGRSLLWILENIATNPSSDLTGIDVHLSYSRENIAISGARERIELMEGPSQLLLRGLAVDSYDIIYIDGSHRGDDVLADSVLSWPLLKDRGTMIFDDYGWHVKPSIISSLVLPPDLRPKEAIDTFVTLYREQLDILHRGHQLIVRKRPRRCAGQDYFYCSPIGNFVYDWRKKEVRDPGTNELVPVTDAEREMLEKLLHDMKLGEVRVEVPRTLRTDPTFVSLRKKLKLGGPVSDDG